VAKALLCWPGGNCQLAPCQGQHDPLATCLPACLPACLLAPACRAQYDADQLPEAKRTLTKALHLAPTDHNLRFDVAVTMQVGAQRAQHTDLPPVIVSLLIARGSAEPAWLPA
jgi:hypothetical protein